MSAPTGTQGHERVPRSPGAYLRWLSGQVGPSGLKPVLVLLTLSAVERFGITIIAVLGPNIRDTFHVSNQTLIGTVALTSILPAAASPWVGYLSDRVDRVRLGQISAVIVGVGAIGLALAPNFAVFDTAGNLYVTDSGQWKKQNGWLLKFDPAGNGQILAGPLGYANGLALSLDEKFADIKFLIRDRGSNFTCAFDAVFQATGARILRTAVQAPDERDLRAPRRHPAPRTPRPDADPRRAASTRRPGRVPGALQHGPAAPGHRPARPRRRT